MSFSEKIQKLDQEVAAAVGRALSEVRREVAERLRSGSEEVLRRLDEFEPDLPSSFVPREELAPIEHEVRTAARGDAFGELRDAVAEVDRARSQAEVLTALLAESARFASRAVLLLVRPGELRGWGAHGFAAEPVRDLALAASRGAWGQVAEGGGAVRLTAAESAELCSRLESDLPGGAVLVPIVLRDRPAAVLYADRIEGEPAAEALQVLAYAAAQAIELLPFRERVETATLRLEPAARETAEPAVSESKRESKRESELEPERAPEPEAMPEAEELEETAALSTVEAPVSAEPAASEPAPELELPEPPAVEEAVEETAEPDAVAAGGAETAAFAAPAPAEPAPAEDVDEDDEENAELQAPPQPIEPSRERRPWWAPRTEPQAVAEAPPAEPEAAPEAEAVAEPAPVQEPQEPPAPEPAPQPSETVMMPRPVAAGFAGAPEIDGDETHPGTLRAVPPSGFEPAAADARPAAPQAVPQASTASPEVRPPSGVQGPGWAFATTRVPVPTSDEALHEEARRLARLLVSEIKLYNEEQVEEGRRNRDVYERLKEDIDRSRQMYEERVERRILQTTDYFYQELVRILAAGDSRALGI